MVHRLNDRPDDIEGRSFRVLAPLNASRRVEFRRSGRRLHN